MPDPAVLARAQAAGVLDIEEILAVPPPPPAGGNGGPSMGPSYAALERIGRVVFFDRWIGKLGEQINVHDKTLRRWAVGEGVPSERAMTKAKTWALTMAQGLLRAVGEDDLAADVNAVLRRHQAPDEATVAATWAATAATVAANVERTRLALEALDAKAEARRAAKAARLAETA